MSSHRFLFYVSSAERDSQTVTLEGDEHHHLHRVVRLSDGDETYVTNGRGLIVRVRIESVSRARAELVCLESVCDVPRPPRLTLALALLRKERFAVALEQCVELGITDCLPFGSSRCHVRQYAPAFLGRLRRIAATAMKQSFQAFLPEVNVPVSVDALAGSLPDYACAMVGAAEAPPVTPVGGDRIIIVGPEAGLDGDELAALRAAGAVTVSVSANRLRSGTAAAALAAALASSD